MCEWGGAGLDHGAVGQGGWVGVGRVCGGSEWPATPPTLCSNSMPTRPLPPTPPLSTPTHPPAQGFYITAIAPHPHTLTPTPLATHTCTHLRRAFTSPLVLPPTPPHPPFAHPPTPPPLHTHTHTRAPAQGFYITAIAGSNNMSSLVVMSKGTKFTQQSYKVSGECLGGWVGGWVWEGEGGAAERTCVPPVGWMNESPPLPPPHRVD